MPSFKTAFPSKFVKADDLGNARPIGTIESVDLEEVGAGQNQERKLVVHFAEHTLKPLVLNLINCDTISDIVGTDDYDAWPGHKIQLFATKTEFQGKRVPCIRVCAPPKAKATGRVTTPPVVPVPDDTTAEVDSEVGF